LFQRVVTQIGELYEQRPVSIAESPPLSPFYGDGNIDWGEWEQLFSNLSILAGATQLDRKLALLPTYLRGAAQTFNHELSHRAQVHATWDDWHLCH